MQGNSWSLQHGSTAAYRTTLWPCALACAPACAVAPVLKSLCSNPMKLALGVCGIAESVHQFSQIYIGRTVGFVLERSGRQKETEVARWRWRAILSQSCLSFCRYSSSLIPRDLLGGNFFDAAAYAIGSHVFTLNDIEHGILRY